MKSRRFTEIVIAVLYILINNDCCSSNAATAMISESHVRPKMYCEFYNQSLCAESRLNGQDEGCSEKKEECAVTDGKPNQCFVVWKEKQGNVSVELKGCFANKDCNETRCIETAEEPNKEFLYCCCVGNMCNKNFTWEPKPKPIIPVLNEPKPVQNPNVIVYIIVIVLFISVLTGIAIATFFCKFGTKTLFNELPTTEPNPLPPPSPLLGLRPIQLLEVKATGRFGAVWKAKFKSEEVAVKIFPVQDKQSWEQEQEIFKLPNMDHPNILHYIGVEKRGGDNINAQFWLITAYHEKGSLCDFLKANTLTWTELCRVVETMARGLMHLHEEIPGKHGMAYKPAIAHRDFKSKNVLLKNNMTACIADFGLALVFESGKSCGDTHGQVGTRRYMGPEVLEGAINFTPDAFLRIDMYACGLVLWELVSRCTAQDGPVPDYRLPFEEEVGQHPSLEDMQEAVVQRKVRPTIPETWRNHAGLVALCETMEECWDHDAEARLSASCVMERVLNQSKYQHSTLTMRIENESPRSPVKENSM